MASKTTDVTGGVGWGEYWVLSVTGADNARVTIPTRLFTPGANSKVCYHVASTIWNCDMTFYDAVSTPNTVTRNPVTINTNLAFAAGNANPTAITLNALDAKAAPDTSAMGWLLALLGAFALSGLWLARKAARD